MTATLNGRTVLECRVCIPAWGAWHATATTDLADVTTGPAVLVLDDLTLRGTIVSAGATSGTRTTFRIVGGAGGWGRVVGPRAYVNDLGVKLALVAGDAAREAGETLGTVAGTVGTSYVRSEGPAARALDDVAPRYWYVDAEGVTQIGRRPRTTLAPEPSPLSTDIARGRVELAPEKLAPLVPGVVVAGVEAVDVEHVIGTDGKARTTIHGRGAVDSLQRLIAAQTDAHRYYAPWEYRVVRRVSDRLDLQAVRVSSGMPDLRNVRVRPSAGCRAYPTIGSLVLVSFVDGDPTRPVVTSTDEADAPGFVPVELFLQAGATGASPTEHATSAEALLLAVQLLHTTLATAIAAIPTNPLTPAALAAAYTTLAGDAGMATYAGLFNAGSLGANTKAALLASLAAKSADTGGDDPGLGWPSVRGG